MTVRPDGCTFVCTMPLAHQATHIHIYNTKWSAVAAVEEYGGLVTSTPRTPTSTHAPPSRFLHLSVYICVWLRTWTSMLAQDYQLAIADGKVVQKACLL